MGISSIYEFNLIFKYDIVLLLFKVAFVGSSVLFFALGVVQSVFVP